LLAFVSFLKTTNVMLFTNNCPIHMKIGDVVLVSSKRPRFVVIVSLTVIPEKFEQLEVFGNTTYKIV